MIQYKLGTVVHWQIGIDGGSGTGLTIGTMAYAESGDVICIAGSGYHGLPINIRWVSELALATSTSIEMAREYREKYLARFPGAFQQEDVDAGEVHGV